MPSSFFLASDEAISLIDPVPSWADQGVFVLTVLLTLATILLVVFAVVAYRAAMRQIGLLIEGRNVMWRVGLHGTTNPQIAVRNAGTSSALNVTVGVVSRRDQWVSRIITEAEIKEGYEIKGLNEDNVQEVEVDGRKTSGGKSFHNEACLLPVDWGGVDEVTIVWHSPNGNAGKAIFKGREYENGWRGLEQTYFRE